MRAWTDETRVMVAERIWDRIRRSVLLDHDENPGVIGQPFAASDLDLADAALGALAEAGLLMVPGGEVRVERGTRIGDGTVLTLTEAGTRYSISGESLRTRVAITTPAGTKVTDPWRREYV